MPSARAPSVPGRSCASRSARSAVSVRRGSTTTTFAPRSCAVATCGIWWMFVSAAFFPHSTISRAFSRSHGALCEFFPSVSRPASSPAGQQRSP